MRPAELFGVVVRTIGLLVLLSAAWALVLATLAVAGGGPGANAMLLAGVPMFVVGWWMLRGGADALVRFAYPDDV
jgi:hypothetical protein